MGPETSSEELYNNLVERVADLEAEGPRGTLGAGSGPQSKNNSKNVVEFKVVAKLGPLTDDKSAFRQWDIKIANAFTQVRKSYGKAIERIREIIDRGKDPEDT